MKLKKRILIPIVSSLVLLGLISYIIYSSLLVCSSEQSLENSPSFLAGHFDSQRDRGSGSGNPQTFNSKTIFKRNRSNFFRNISVSKRRYGSHGHSRHREQLRLHSRTCKNVNSSSIVLSSDYWNRKSLGQPLKTRSYSAASEDDAIFRGYSLDQKLIVFSRVKNRAINSMTQLDRVASKLSFLNYFLPEDTFAGGKHAASEKPARSGHSERFWQSRSLLSAAKGRSNPTQFSKGKTAKIFQKNFRNRDDEHQAFRCVLSTENMGNSQNWPEKSLSREEWLPAVPLITKLLHDLKISEVHLCSSDRRSRLHLLLSLSLPRALLYTGTCSSTQLQDTAPSISTGATLTYRYRSALLYLVDSGQEVELLQLLLSHDSITKGSFYAIVVSSSPRSCFESPGLRTTHWMHVTFSNAGEATLHVHESYSILGAAQPIVVYLGAVRYRNQSGDGADRRPPPELLSGRNYHPSLQRTINDRTLHNVKVQLHQKPRQGPSNFNNHFINVITLMVPPYVMPLPSHCLRGRAAVELKHNVGLLGPDDDYCPLAHHAWRRLHLKNNSSSGGVPLAPQEPRYGGYLVDLLMTLAHKLNFSVMLQFPPAEDAYFGLDRGNGSFTGLVGALQRREADLSLGPFTMTRDRLRFIDFSVAVDRSSASLFINQDAVVSAVGWGTYILSFHWTAWVALLLLLISCSVVLVVMVRYDPQEDQYFGSTSNVIFIFFSCLVQQGLTRLPVTARAKTVLFLFWLSSSVLYTFYTARLTSSFTTSTAVLPFHDLKAAMASPSWKIGLLAGTSLLDILRSSEGSQYAELYAATQRTPSIFVRSDEEGVARLLSEEKFAYFCESSSVTYLMRGNCSIMKVSGDHLSRYQHIGYSKHLPFADILNAELTKLLMGGVMENLKFRWWGQLTSCSLHAPYTELDFSNIVTAYMVLAVGTTISAFVFFVEFFSGKCKQRTPHSALRQSQAQPPGASSKQTLSAGNGCARHREENGCASQRSFTRNSFRSKNAYNISVIPVQNFDVANASLNEAGLKCKARAGIFEGNADDTPDGELGVLRVDNNRKRSASYGNYMKASNSFCDKEHLTDQVSRTASKCTRENMIGSSMGCTSASAARDTDCDRGREMTNLLSTGDVGTV